MLIFIPSEAPLAVSPIEFRFYQDFHRLQWWSCMNAYPQFIYPMILNLTSPVGECLCRGHNPFFTESYAIVNCERPCDALIVEVTGMSA